MRQLLKRNLRPETVLVLALGQLDAGGLVRRVPGDDARMFPVVLRFSVDAQELSSRFGRVIFDGTPQQAFSILGAMATVARSGSGGVLTSVDRVAIESAAELVFGVPDRIDVDRLTSISPNRFAEVLEDRAHEAMVPLVVISTVDGAVAPSAADLVRDYADAAEVSEPAVADLEALVHGELAKARADMLRRNRESITGDWVLDTSTYSQWLFPYRGSPDAGLAERYRSLGSCEEGSFGRAFHEFYLDNGFGFAGESESASEDFSTPHDSAHVLSGYDTSVQGELLVSTFTAGMHVVEGLSGHILPVILSWHLGVPLAELAGSTTGALDARKLWAAWVRGDATAGDTFDPDWDFWSQVDRPLREVRAELAVPVLAVGDAADGANPDWYRPSA